MPGLSSWAVRRPVLALVAWLVAVIAIFLSNVPEGLSSAAGMKHAGRPVWYVFGVWTAIAIVGVVVWVGAHLPAIQSLEIPKRPPTIQIVGVDGNRWVVVLVPPERRRHPVAVRDVCLLRRNGNATAVAKTLLNAGYNVGTAANYVPASGGQVSVSAVYYLSADDQALADAIAKKLSTAKVQMKATISSEFSDAITVVLGSDLN